MRKPRRRNGYVGHRFSNEAVEAFRLRTLPPSRRLLYTADDSVGVGSLGAAQLFDCTSHIRLAVFVQQLQDTDKLPDTVTRSVSIFQPCSQLAKYGREFPFAVDV